jgi:hypothetical protein
MAKTWKERLAEEQAKQQELLTRHNEISTQPPLVNFPNNDAFASLPAEVQKEILAFATEQTKDIDTRDQHGFGFFSGTLTGVKIGAVEYAAKMQQLELKRMNDMATRLLETTSKQCRMRKTLLREINAFLYEQ